MLKKQKRYLYLNAEEISVVLQSLIRLKNALTHMGRYLHLPNFSDRSVCVGHKRGIQQKRMRNFSHSS